MRKIKVILGILVVLLVLLAVAVIIVGTHLGDIVKAGMEVAGPKVTQTTLTVDAVNISLLGGSAGVKNLVLGNPEGYKAPQSISVSNAAVTLVPSSVLSDKIVIRSIEVRAPDITFEGNPLGENNLTKIMANVNAFESTPGASNAPAASTPAHPKPAKKLEVDDFLITGAQVHAKLTGLINQDITVPIPEIHLTGLGTGPDGITAADLTQKVLSELTAATIKTLVQSVEHLSKNATDAARKAAEGAVENAVKNTGLNGTNNVKSLENGLKGLFKK